MDENQLEKLGSKMRDAYTDMASEAALPAETAPKQPSRRLRKNRAFARPPGRRVASTPTGAIGSFVSQHPMASLLLAVGAGYLVARL